MRVCLVKSRSIVSGSILLRRRFAHGACRWCFMASLKDCPIGSPHEPACAVQMRVRSEEHTSELQSPDHLVCRLLLEKKKKKLNSRTTHNPALTSTTNVK